MSTVSNIFLIGPTGAGKTTIGRRLARRFGLEFVDLDQEIERRTGADIALIFDIEGEVGFRRRESQLLDELTARSNVLLATGAGAVLAADNRNYLASRGCVVYLKTPVQRQIDRLYRDKRRPLLQKPNRHEILEKMALERNPIYEELADVIIESEPVSVARMARSVARRLEQRFDASDRSHHG